MSLLLARIDDRYIHGQVVVGCCGALDAQRLILCDDDIARDSLQTRIYRAAVPSPIEVEVLGVESTANRLAELEQEGRARTIVVTGNCATMLALCRTAPAIERVCVGGLHHRRGARELWPGFFLDDEDVACLREVLDLGVEILVQSVPGASSIDAAMELRAASSSP